eukprot:8706496-Heterocapsa_arctica.AAC.1
MNTEASNSAAFASEFLRGFCHGDDFCVVACKFEGSRTGMIGFQGNYDTELKILNRTVRVCVEKDMIELERMQGMSSSCWRS